MRSIAVFGGGDWNRGDDVWRLALEIGRRIAASGFEVVTGGYGGVMEAASEGALEAGGNPRGIVHLDPAVRLPNSSVKVIERASDYQDRMARLLRISECVALPGFSGTFAEISASAAMLKRHKGRRVALWAPWWRPRLRDILIEMSGGHDPGVDWLEDLSAFERWLLREAPR